MRLVPPRVQLDSTMETVMKKFRGVFQRDINSFAKNVQKILRNNKSKLHELSALAFHN